MSTRADKRLTHAGGVVRRVVNGATHVLLVRAKRTSDWIFPKGHIEAGESPEQTAVREVREEAGVQASVQRYLDTQTFVSPRGEQVRVAFFLMEYVGEVAPEEQREIRWCSSADALTLMPFDDGRALIRTALEGSG